MTAAAIDKATNYTDLLGASASTVADAVIAKAIEAGNPNPSRGAVLDAAITNMLQIWHDDMPHMWAGFCRENGIPTN